MISIPTTTPSALLPAFFIQGWASADELHWIFNESSRHQTVMEIGSYRGRSTFAWLAGGCGRVISIDPLNWGRWSADIEAEILSANLKQFEPRWSLIRNRSSESVPELTRILAGQPLDLAFIDGDHSAVGVLTDISIAMQMVRPGGVICGHDYSTPNNHFALQYPDLTRIIDHRFPNASFPAGSIWTWTKPA